MKKFAVIMAGGLGSRFWPKSTEKNPKQFIHLTGDGTMIQNTFERLKDWVDTEDIYIITNENLQNSVIDQIPEFGEQNMILEPFGRNTAPALGLVYTHLSAKYKPEDIMIAIPSDQVVSNLGEFFNSLEIACKTASELKGIVTIGINPARPETQYGYVQVDEERREIGSLYDEGVRYCTTFAEKPDKSTAGRFIESGDFVWNSGIFVMRTDTFKTAFDQYLPFHADQFDNLRFHLGKVSYWEELEKLYKTINPISMDYGILEKADNVFVVKSNFTWTDLGNWDELHRISMKDARNNVVTGNVVALNTNGCLIKSSSGKMIGTYGLDDLIIVECDDSILICKRGKSENVQELVDFMRKNNITKPL